MYYSLTQRVEPIDGRHHFQRSLALTQPKFICEREQSLRIHSLGQSLPCSLTHDQFPLFLTMIEDDTPSVSIFLYFSPLFDISTTMVNVLSSLFLSLLFMFKCTLSLASFSYDVWTVCIDSSASYSVE